MLVEVELRRILTDDAREQNVIFLKEVNGDRMLPIMIGACEAMSIHRRVNGEILHRPMTHQLLKNVIEQLGGEVQDVVVTELRDHTYYAVIRIRVDDELIEIDSRPSDAIALSVHFDPHLPIYVREEVFEAAS
ncbi:MAG: bifunctional nuclease family protein [Planctomycetota bacterium]|nr:MAG: bifunctional nuclease family protein [Planctomycetota bacterium]